LGLAFVLLSGCGAGTATVTGEVLVDGQPLQQGVISFVPADEQGEPASDNIENGKYEIQMLAGKKLVQISAPVVVGRRDEYELTEESLPDRYHAKTELTYDAPSGPSTKNWSLESNKRRP
jgi:hypothetical protein